MVKRKPKLKADDGEPSSLRSANIRIHMHNELEDSSIKVYTRDYWEDFFRQWIEQAPNSLKHWALNEHDAGSPDAHIHVVLKFGNPMPFVQLKKYIPYGSIKKPFSYPASMQYLIHLNHPEKEQFANGWDAITSNYESLDEFKVRTKKQQDIDLERVIELCDTGKIRDWNKSIMIPASIWAHDAAKIKRAMELYIERVCMDKNREIQVMFFSGVTDVGKTTYAKNMCTKQHMSYDVSSSSNDPFQDYAGQDVLILDDLRDSAFTLEDLLKILDNNTRSTSKSRYKNKSFIGNLIIITSNTPLDQWYLMASKRDKNALYRRIKKVYEFEPEVIYEYDYVEDSKNDYPYELKTYDTNPKYEYEKKPAILRSAFSAMGKAGIPIKTRLPADTWKKV